MKMNLVLTLSFLLALPLAAPGCVAQAASKPAPSPSEPSATPHPHSRYVPNHLPTKANEYYSVVWGVDSLTVRAVEAGKLIRFSYRVVDPAKAGVFNNKNVEAFLDSPEHNVRLVVPTMEKVGQLRQTNKPEEGRSYWMAFSNPQRTIKHGDRVNVVIGGFHADGLVVE